MVPKAPFGVHTEVFFISVSCSDGAHSCQTAHGRACWLTAPALPLNRRGWCEHERIIYLTTATILSGAYQVDNRDETGLRLSHARAVDVPDKRVSREGGESACKEDQGQLFMEQNMGKEE